MNTLAATFNFQDSLIRTAGTIDDPMFCVKDVCSVLGVKNHLNKVAQLDEDEKLSIQTLDAQNRTRPTTFCTEPGLYNIIFSVQKNSKTEAFKRWVFHDVLPSIRKTGKYLTDKLIKENKALKEEVDRRLFLVQKDAVKEWRLEQGYRNTDYEWRNKNFTNCCSRLLGTTYKKGNTPYVHKEYMPNAKQSIKDYYGFCQRNPESTSPPLDQPSLEYYLPPQ